MKKVLIITYYWPPSGGAGVQRWLKFTKYFKDFGIEPIVITVNPRKASYPVIDKTLLDDIGSHVRVYSTDTFEPYAAYKKVSGKEEIPFSGFANESDPTLIQKITRFIRGNFFIPDSRKGWNKYAIRKAREIIEKEKIDAIITTSPPHSTQLIGLRLKEEFKLPWLADLRDPWTDIYYYKQLNHIKLAANIDLKLEREVLEKADKIVVVSESIKAMFASKSVKVDTQKIHVIPNGFDEDDFKNTSERNENDEFILTYTGTLSDIYNPQVFIDAFKEISSENKNLKLRLIGRVSKEILDKLNVSNVEVIKHVEHQKSIEYMVNSDALLLVIPKIKDNEGILTGKLFEYLAAEKPIIAIGPKSGDAAVIINECNAGKMFEYEEKSSLKSYLLELVNDWKTGNDKNNYSMNYRKYSRKELTKNLLRVLGL